MSHVIEVEGVEKRFGKTPALRGVSFALRCAGVTVLLGENGAGKSTLLRLLLGVLPPDAGTIRVLGRDPFRHGDAVRERVGYVADRHDCPDWMTPRELFRFLAPHYRTWDAARALSLATAYEVPLDRPFGKLSRGEAARAQLAAALAPSPELLLVDEAFSGLDPLARRELLGHFLTELAEHQVAVLLATHDLDVAARAADAALVLHEGKLCAAGSMADLLGGEDAARLPQSLIELLERVRSPLPTRPALAQEAVA
jgi:ABC-2 type transport system ATP-binding protein